MALRPAAISASGWPEASPLLAKLGVQSRLEAAAIARRLGLDWLACYAVLLLT